VGPARDHEVDHNEELVGQRETDRSRKRLSRTSPSEDVAEDALLECFDIDRNVGKLGHVLRIVSRRAKR